MSRDMFNRKIPSARQGRRGKWWENFLEPLHYRYNTSRRALVEKNHPSFKVIFRKGAQFTGAFDGKGQPDYTGFVDGLSFYAEAKEADGKRFPWQDLRPHQAISFERALCQSAGAFIFLRETDAGLAHVLPWLRIRERWFCWREKWERRERAGPGEASIDFGLVRDLSIYTNSTGPGWDYLNALQHYMTHLEAWREEQRRQLLAAPPRTVTFQTRRGRR